MLLLFSSSPAGYVIQLYLISYSREQPEYITQRFPYLLSTSWRYDESSFPPCVIIGFLYIITKHYKISSLQKKMIKKKNKNNVQFIILEVTAEHQVSTKGG